VWFCAAKRPVKKVSFLGSVFGQAKMEHREIIIPNRCIFTIHLLEKVQYQALQESLDHALPTKV
jgi:hypothetical protein